MRARGNAGEGECIRPIPFPVHRNLADSQPVQTGFVARRPLGAISIARVPLPARVAWRRTRVPTRPRGMASNPRPRPPAWHGVEPASPPARVASRPA